MRQVSMSMQKSENSRKLRILVSDCADVGLQLLLNPLTRQTCICSVVATAFRHTLNVTSELLLRSGNE